MQGEVHELFVKYSADKLRQMCSHIESCLGRLSDDQIWSRGGFKEHAQDGLGFNPAAPSSSVFPSPVAARSRAVCASNENSIGNLVLHLCGNVRQWTCSGVGGAKDVRERDGEFSASGGFSAAELVERMKATVGEAVVIIEGVSAKRLTEQINPQNHLVSVLEAIYQVVGHFQQHTGQIIFATKMYTGEDLGFYRPPK